MKIHFLKTVWSDMIILEDNDRFALVDTGMADQYEQLSEYLNNMGVKTIEFILLTHFHRDHYGNIENLVRDYDVEKVYFKEYGGHDNTTAWGTEADEAYRQLERDKWKHLKEAVEESSFLQLVENVETIDFAGVELSLFGTENSVQKIWDDDSNEETYHKNLFGENQNSLAVFFEVNGKTVFLGGDVMDHPSAHSLGHYRNLQIAKQINKKIYLYKAPHHGTDHTACKETLEIYQPEIAVITNGMEWLSHYASMEDLKKVNPNVEILLTEEQDVVISL